MLRRICARVALLAVLWAALASVAGAAPALPDSNAGSPRLHVDLDATGNADGSSWQHAFTDLQLALVEARALAAGGRVEVWVAEGVYRPNTPAASQNDRGRAFQLASNVALYGGFDGTESTLEQRDPATHVTVLSGDMSGDDSTDANGVTPTADDIVGVNSYHVVTANGVDDSAELDGFAITAGHANAGGLISPFLMRHGAGLYLYDSGPMLRHLIVRGNRAPNSNGAGAGLYAESTTPSTPYTLHLHDVRFLHNHGSQGGGLYSIRTRLRGDAIEFLHNSGVTGGAMYLTLVSDVRFTNSVFAGNSASEDGGAIRGFREQIALVNSLITGNHAAGDGGAYYSNGTSNLNMLIVLTNVTMAGNRAGGSGGGIHRTLADNGGTRLFNTVIWDNEDATGNGTASASHGGPGAARLVAANSLVQGMLAPGNDNLDGTLPGNAPLFFAPLDPAAAPSAAGDFHVQIGSPGVDRGDNQARINPTPGSLPAVPLEGTVLHDLDGRDRILDGDNDSVATVDLGPYEGVSYTIGGSVVGLAGSGLVLRNNGGDDLAVAANGSFTFSQVVADGEAYDVTVATQPDAPSQECSVAGGDGVVDAASVDDIVVSCQTNSFTVTPSAGSNGQITPDTPQSVLSLDTTSFTVTADGGFTASVGGTCGGSLVGATYTTDPVESDCTVEASFAPTTYAVTPSAGPNGSISPDSVQTVLEGATAVFDVVADSGFDARVDGSCGGSLDGNEFTTAAIAADCTVEASFVPRTSGTVTASANPTRLSQPVEFSVEVVGLDMAPVDGRIDVSATSGESCADTGTPQIVGDTARFACSISFASLGEHQVHAVYSSSSTHSDSTTPAIDVAVKRFADIEVEIDDGELHVDPGSSVAYLIQLRNDGPDDAPNTALVLIADPALQSPTWLCTAAGGGSCPAASGSGEISIVADLPAGSSLEFLQQGELPDSLPAVVMTTVDASVSGDAPDEVFDPDGANNSATDLNTSDAVFGDGFEETPALR